MSCWPQHKPLEGEIQKTALYFLTDLNFPEESVRTDNERTESHVRDR